MPAFGGRRLGPVEPATFVNRVQPFLATNHDTLISAFQSGHGFVAGGAGSQTDDTSVFTAGSRSLQITPPSNGTEQTSTKTIAATDLSGSYLRFAVYLGGVIGSLKVRVASGTIATDYAEATIWSSSVRSWVATGQWEHAWIPRGEFTVTGTVNWSAITTIQFAATATGAGTVNCKLNRVSYVPDASEGCVVFAFDDGLSSVWDRARVKLGEYNWPGTAFIIADMIDTGTSVDARGAMTTAQLQELQYRYGWEISSHAYYLANHNAGSGFTSVSVSDTERDFYLMRDWLDKRGLTGGSSFAWPLGAYGSNQTYMDIARRYFDVSRSTKGFSGGRSHEVRHHALDRHRVNGWSINGLTDSTGDISTAVTQAKDRKEILVLVFHQLTTGSVSASTDWSVTNFNTVVDAVATAGVPVKTFGQAFGGF